MLIVEWTSWNTWVWEERFGGDDGDLNDVIVGNDFIGAGGHGWLV